MDLLFSRHLFHYIFHYIFLFYVHVMANKVPYNTKLLLNAVEGGENAAKKCPFSKKTCYLSRTYCVAQVT